MNAGGPPPASPAPPRRTTSPSPEECLWEAHRRSRGHLGVIHPPPSTTSPFLIAAAPDRAHQGGSMILRSLGAGNVRDITENRGLPVPSTFSTVPGPERAVLRIGRFNVLKKYYIGHRKTPPKPRMNAPKTTYANAPKTTYGSTVFPQLEGFGAKTTYERGEGGQPLAVVPGWPVTRRTWRGACRRASAPSRI